MNFRKYTFTLLAIITIMGMSLTSCSSDNEFEEKTDVEQPTTRWSSTALLPTIITFYGENGVPEEQEEFHLSYDNLNRIKAFEVKKSRQNSGNSKYLLEYEGDTEKLSSVHRQSDTYNLYEFRNHENEVVIVAYTFGASFLRTKDDIITLENSSGNVSYTYKTNFPKYGLLSKKSASNSIEITQYDGNSGVLMNVNTPFWIYSLLPAVSYENLPFLVKMNPSWYTRTKNGVSQTICPVYYYNYAGYPVEAYEEGKKVAKFEYTYAN